MNTNGNDELRGATTVARRTPRDLWSRILIAVGGIAMLIGGLDPLEGSVLILPGSGLLALGTFLGHAERRLIAYRVWAFVLVAIGVGALWGLSLQGGFGGTSGRSNWWGLLILPGLIGWSMGLWGPGSPRWLALLGVAVGLWYLNLAFMAKGAVGIVCGIVGVLTIGGCIYRLRNGMKAKAMTMLAAADVVVAASGGVLAGEPAKAKPPVRETYTQKFNTLTNVNGMAVVGQVEFYSTNNSVTFARLATNTVMWGQPLPAGTGIHFTPDGKPNWCFLSKDHAIKGHLFRRGHNWMTGFYPSGQLESGGLVNVETIDGIPCAASSAGPRFFSTNPRTHFYEDGRLKSAEVAETITYRGQTIQKGKRVQLKPDGSIESIK